MIAGDPGRPEKLRLAVQAWRLFAPSDTDNAIAWDARGFVGSLSSRNLSLLKRLEAASLLYTDADLDAVDPTSLDPIEVTLEFEDLRSSDAYFAPSLEAMLSENVAFQYEHPQHFYLAELTPPDGEAAPEDHEETSGNSAPSTAPTAGHLYPDEHASQPELVSNYLAAIRFGALLTDASNFATDHAGRRELSFTSVRDVTLPLTFSAADLRAISDDDLDGIEALIEIDKYALQTKDILKSALVETLDSSDGTFAELLEQFAAFNQRFKDNYHLFMSEFSFDKIRDQAEERRLAYTEKLNKVFADIQSKLLAIPVALIIVASQMKTDEDATLENLIVVFGAFAFAGLMIMLILNQWDTLKVIKSEIDREKEEVKDHPNVFDKLEPIYVDLESRHNRQMFQLVGVGIVTGLSALLPVAVFVYYEFIV